MLGEPAESAYLIDTHCHVNVEEYFPDPASAIADAKSAGVVILILVSIDVDGGKRALDLCEQHDGVFAVIGLHPNYASGYGRHALAGLEELLKHPKTVALGEIGLDYHHTHASREVQLRSLMDQLELASSTATPVVFHCREAYADLLDILENRPPHPYLFHCFSGDEADAKRATELDCYFGVDGPITYKGKKQFKALIASLPRERLLLETDSPFMTPEPFRGRPNAPAFLPYINGGLAGVLEISAEACARLTTENAERFFRLKRD